MGDEEGERFWTLLIADMDEELVKGGWGGGVKVGERKIFTLTYADDVAMLTEDEDEMRGMIGS